jgi:cobalt-zinc-cadmium efflux system protein
LREVQQYSLIAHQHSHHHPNLDARRADNRRRMATALWINVALVAIEVAGGILTGSLAVLADAGHVLTDVGAIVLALAAARLATREGGGRRTFGYRRGEVLAALVNGLVLIGIAVGVVIVGIGRLSGPPHVAGGGVLALGLVAMAGNGLATAVLARGERADINLEAVLRHSAVDAAGAFAVVVSGIVVLATGWRQVDALASFAIAILIVASSVRVVREPVDILMEAAPRGVDVDEVGQAICRVEGVTAVHELHVWTVTPGFEALAAHVVVSRDADRDRARQVLEFELRERFGIEHTTLQMEAEADPGPLQIS